jgi:hypothetical protein
MVPDQGAVEQFVPTALDPAFHDRVHAGHLDAAECNADPSFGKDRVEQDRVPAVAIADQIAGAAANVRSIERLRTAWVTHAAVGWAVAPGMRIRRVACSMTARTYSHVPVNVAAAA